MLKVLVEGNVTANNFLGKNLFSLGQLAIWPRKQKLIRIFIKVWK